MSYLALQQASETRRSVYPLSPETKYSAPDTPVGKTACTASGCGSFCVVGSLLPSGRFISTITRLWPRRLQNFDLRRRHGIPNPEPLYR